MDRSFWLERWDQHQIGFHQPDVNPYLQAHWRQWGVAPHATIFVPLCGKSLDMAWLRQQGHTIVGIEISRTALREFFEEQRIEPRVTRSPRFEYWESPGYRLLCGDFFALEPSDLEDVAGVYDRAALVALPTEMRQRYVDKTMTIVPSQIPVLLIAMTYPQEQMNGPPFAVDAAEVRRLYAGHDIEELQDEEVLSREENARFKERGLRSLSEQVYRVRRRN